MVLAAGEGTRMRSARPKPLHLLCGRHMVLHIVHTIAELSLDRAVVVVGHSAERVTKTLIEQAPPDLPIEFVEQHVQRGTGDAVAVGLTAFAGADSDADDDDDGGDLLVVPGDTPLLRATTLAALVSAHRRTDAAATLLTAVLPDPTGYGRVIRSKDGRVSRIVEDRDATDEELEIDEVNTSIYCFRRSILAPALRRLTPDNAQGEYYLTDVISVLHDVGYNVISMVASDPMETAGINDRAQLAIAEAELRDRINDRWMRMGVTMIDPERTYIDSTVSLAADVTLFPGVVLQGATSVADHAEIGPDTRLVDCHVGEGAIIENTVARRAEIGAGANVGPYAVLHPGDHVLPGTVTGPFFTSEG
jgi:bifunctional UDP-N-acetylglucosamine pyrophosphorylase/glucosamine-1-phosphate N-acetyltransferase